MSGALEDWRDRHVGTGSGGAVLADAFYPLYERVFDAEDDFVRTTEQKLAEARIADTVEEYLSRALGVGFIAGVSFWVIGLLLGYLLVASGVVEIGTIVGITIGDPTVRAFVNAMKEPALVLSAGLIFGAIGFAIGFGSLVAIPYSRAGARRREIDLLLADAVSYMYALSIGGMNQIEILEAMARADDTYGEVALEFQSIMQDTDYFDTDYRTSIRKQVDMTPSDDLSQFLTDMLAIINSGGSMEQFLADKKRTHMRAAKQHQERVLDTLELFGEMFITLSLFPLLLIIVIVVMGMLGEASAALLYLTVYGLIPLIGVGFLILVSMVTTDEPGSGYLEEVHEDWYGGQTMAETSLFRFLRVDELPAPYRVFEKVRSGELTHQLRSTLREPHVYFRENPLHTCFVSAPMAAAALALVGLVVGGVPTTFDGMVANPVWGTVFWVYLPLYIVLIPLGVFYEWNLRHRYGILDTLSEDLRKLAAVNDTGMTLLESVGTVGQTSTGTLADEFRTIYMKVNYGMSINEALFDFNNRYHIPRLARTVKLVSKAQSVSNEIRAVLSTAAQASENQDDIERDRRDRTRMQVAIIVMTFLTLLAMIAILKTQFLNTMTDLSASGDGGGLPGGFGGSMDLELISLLFFHALTIQAVISGVISGYIRNVRLLAGVKYVLAMLTMALAVWVVVG
jgi:flagellar protein FlaJ